MVHLLVVILTGLGLALPFVPPVPTGTDFDYQLGGTRSVPVDVGIVVRDRKAAPVTGVHNVCYVNGFQTQPDEKHFWRNHRGLLLKRHGRFVRDEEWGERILDIRRPAKRKRLARIVGRWVEGCAADGFASVEFDNLDSFSRSHGLIKRKHAKKFARLLTREAHRAGLAAGQKNWAGLNGRRLGFDFAVAEECGRYDECGDYVATYGRAVLVVEYRKRDFKKTCREYGDQVAVVLRDRALARNGRRAWC
ncbi:endo alpha-1,4 polygalactosaminidase [Nocardioides alcanivorans]|uniref:endo alpha-1,4 polygalactosaminidase n=1 Tax=Nocardioides alcanivorans TaxID=2897352 RepID=UPI001F198856|nr:endo alpha-1,4 polygalactosaminidase [Nocardioides alcanivorans]